MVLFFATHFYIIWSQFQRWIQTPQNGFRDQQATTPADIALHQQGNDIGNRNYKPNVNKNAKSKAAIQTQAKPGSDMDTDLEIES